MICNIRKQTEGAMEVHVGVQTGRDGLLPIGATLLQNEKCTYQQILNEGHTFQITQSHQFIIIAVRIKRDSRGFFQRCVISDRAQVEWLSASIGVCLDQVAVRR